MLHLEQAGEQKLLKSNKKFLNAEEVTKKRLADNTSYGYTEHPFLLNSSVGAG